MSKNFYVLNTLWKCNWSCGFCMVDTHNRTDEITLESIKEKLSVVESGSEVVISGGEPGLLEKDYLQYIIDEINKKNCTMSINTNGTFFKNHPEFDYEIDTYFYHCSEDLTNDVYIPEHIRYNKIDFMIVVSDNNYHSLESFLNKHPDIEITIYGAEQSLGEYKKGETLSRKNAFDIIKKYRSRLNKESISYLLEDCSTINDRDDNRIFL